MMVEEKKKRTLRASRGVRQEDTDNNNEMNGEYERLQVTGLYLNILIWGKFDFS